jgi:hypothetical protein
MLVNEKAIAWHVRGCVFGQAANAPPPVWSGARGAP